MATTVQQDPLLAKINAVAALTPEEIAAAHAGATSGAGSAAPAPVPYTATNPAPAAPAPTPATAAPATTAPAATATSTTAPAPTAPTVALQPGNTGDNVTALQQWLATQTNPATGQPYLTAPQIATGPGIYGPQTTAAVAAWQKANNVDNSTGVGFWGPRSQAAAASAAAAATSGGLNGSGVTTGGTAAGSDTTSGTGSDGTTSNPNDPYAGLDPISKQVKMYQDTATALGLPTIKQQYDDILKQQSDLTNEMNDKISEVQNNPWLSQGLMDKTVQAVKDKYATRLDTFAKLETLYDSMYKQGQAQVESIVSNANADIKATNDLAQKQLDAAAALAKDNQVVSVGGRELLINKETGKTVADLGPTPKSTTTTQADQNAATSQQISAQLTKAEGSDGYTDPNLYARLRASSTLSAQEFDNRFGYLVNPLSTARLGIGSTSTNQGDLTAAALKQQINQQIATPDFKALSDSQKADYILSQGGTPSDYGY